MTSGERVIRKFAEHAEIEELYAFVECYDVLKSRESAPAAVIEPVFDHEYKFRLVSPMPRAVYDVKAGGAIGERIGRSANLIVEPIDEGDDEDL